MLRTCLNCSRTFSSTPPSSKSTLELSTTSRMICWYTPPTCVFDMMMDSCAILCGERSSLLLCWLRRLIAGLAFNDRKHNKLTMQEIEYGSANRLSRYSTRDRGSVLCLDWVGFVPLSLGMTRRQCIAVNRPPNSLLHTTQPLSQYPNSSGRLVLVNDSRRAPVRVLFVRLTCPRRYRVLGLRCCRRDGGFGKVIGNCRPLAAD